MGVGTGSGIPRMPERQGVFREAGLGRACDPGLQRATLQRPPSRPGAPGLSLPRGPCSDPEALRKRFRSGLRQDGGGHAGEAGGRGANAAGGGARERAAVAGALGRRLRG